MMNTLAKWTFGVTAGFLAGAVAIAMTTGPAWADSCSGASIAHGNADCLTVAYSNGRQTLFLTNACPDLGVVTAAVKVINYGGEGTAWSLQALSTSETLIETIVNDDDATYSNARCCPASGVCAITDCDTTDGVIDDMGHKTHCRLIDDSTGSLNALYLERGAEITNGVVTYPSHSTDEPR